MANLLNRTDWSFAKSGTTTTWSITIPATTSGSKLVLVAFGGSTVTAKITNGSGTSFNVRNNLTSGQGVSIHDFDVVGGETAVFITLTGAENVAGTIYEFGPGLTFVAGSNSGGAIVPGASNDRQSKPAAANLGANANGLLVGAWTVTATLASNPFSLTNQWHQMGPLGKLYVNNGLQPGVNTQFIYASGLADVTNTARYPLSESNAGDYRATSMWINSTGNTYSVQALYADTSGVATNPAPANAIAAENSLPGTDQANWFLTAANATNAAIAGYTDKTSYLPGDTVNFQVDSGNLAFRVEVYRLGYYGWETMGARLMTGNAAGYITGSPAVQPSPTVDGTLGSTSCGWSTTASWSIPSNAPPGVYHVIYRATAIPTNAATGHFVVRGSPTGKPVVVIPDMTHQAYNVWGATTDHGSLATAWSGRSLYTSGPDGAVTNFAHRAYAVSFDRPYGTQSMQSNTYLFDAAYGFIHFCEAQGYDFTYLSDTDLDGNTTLLNTAKCVIMLGHHEYWTTGVYNCFTNAVDAGVPLFIDSSNTALWHVRFAAADTNKRTVICYKDSGSQDVSAGFTGTGFDPVSYTGTWRDTRTGGSVNNTDIRSENRLTGQLFRVSAPISVAITVPFAQKTLPIWRNSASVQALTVGNSYTTPYGSLGDELDVPDGSTGQPANLVQLCPTATGTLTSGANANGTIYSTSVSLTASFTLYWRNSGTLVFNTGSWRGWMGISRWAKATLAGTVTAVDLNWQNALLAILYDMGVRPAAVRELRPGIDTALTDPSTGAPSGTISQVAQAYGLSFTSTPGPVVVGLPRRPHPSKIRISRAPLFPGPPANAVSKASVSAFATSVATVSGG